MKQELIKFIREAKFPCVMAKAVLANGYLKLHEFNQIEDCLKAVYEFIDHYRANSNKLSSFIVTFDSQISFEDFEKQFWIILKEMNKRDKEIYPHDPRVNSDSSSADFSFSLKSEAFFILALHPDSPRFARRFAAPAIVFNPHQQFENLRAKNLFNKVRNLIRKRDLLLQGEINPMLNDFGEKSEIYQYTGRVYSPEAQLSL
jgi:uncharacterized protein